ncbi:MAG: alpha/beta fold hydrolase, partial [Acetobacteraceae bacterium]|nr:alpha/beta fold hydrolase [Acetobacteraceae bacterium]
MPQDVQEFTIRIREPALADMYERLRRTRFPRDYANENWEYGFPTQYLRDVVEYWIEEYDWREAEQALNAMAPHFKTTIDGVPIHFLHKRSAGRNPMPLLLHHGWPWTFWDLRKVIGPLTDPGSHGGNASDSFDIVLISLPGFGFSSPLTKTGVNFHTTADIEHTLMTEILGYPRYATAGGDWGAIIAEQHGHKYERDVIGVYTHLPVQLSHYLSEHPDVPPGIAYNY